MRTIVFVLLVLGTLLPAVSKGQGGYTRRRSSATPTTVGRYTGPDVTFKGTLKVLDKKEIILALDAADPEQDQDQDHSLTMRRTGKTKFFRNDDEIKAADIPPNARVTIDCTREGDMKLAAVRVMIAAPAAKPEAK